MEKLKLFFIVFILSFSSTFSFGQDVHFSSFDANPMLLNPANTAFGSNLFRAGTIYRNQWSTVSQGYNSYLLTAEVLPYPRNPQPALKSAQLNKMTISGKQARSF